MKIDEIIKIENLTVSFGDFTALNNISCSINENSGVVGLIGPNGAGKTTLINTILGQVKISNGTVFCDHNDIAYCPDMPSFEPYLTAEEVLEQSLRLKRKNIRKNSENIDTILSSVGLKDAKNRFVGSFSRGMKQRLGIASAIILEPKLIFLDEPTSALDPFGKADILSLISNIAQSFTIVISSHSLNDIEKIADTLLVLNKGNLLFSGKLIDFLSEGSLYAEVEIKDSTSLDYVLSYFRDNGVDAFTESQNPRVIKFSKEYFSSVLSISANISQYIQSCSNKKMSLDDAFSNLVRSFKIS
ncbi:ABC transporter ATP-binding protein [Bacillus atrophaeus]|uniref:ABC transporter ATP-binding protein n=1 Tax=Bacillus atrophaeus TaxID=1452 RepID=UPI0022815A5A|nr:ABC transporter ATP-binding protein [Bacillus atrophaeus]MCY8486834.1 ABC transporter ATP-binding protein [Bacillus atrophaeus]